jgi:hypothetical protein
MKFYCSKGPCLRSLTVIRSVIYLKQYFRYPAAFEKVRKQISETSLSCGRADLYFKGIHKVRDCWFESHRGMNICLLWVLFVVRYLCDELITRPDASYRLWSVVVCDLETSWMSRTWPTLADEPKKNNILIKWSKPSHKKSHIKGSLNCIIHKNALDVSSTKHVMRCLFVLFVWIRWQDQCSLYAACNHCPFSAWNCKACRMLTQIYWPFPSHLICLGHSDRLLWLINKTSVSEVS